MFAKRLPNDGKLRMRASMPSLRWHGVPYACDLRRQYMSLRQDEVLER
jgi:hypothetical protein